MKRLILAAFLLTAGPAWAQPMEEIVAADTVEVRVQQTRTFVFDRPVSSVVLSATGVAEAVPESDRTLNIRGLKPGRILMTAYGDGGRVVHRSNILVLQAGGYVRIYGQGNGSGGKTKDFVGFYCDGSGCGRADSDVPSVPFSTTITETIQQPGGSPATVSREYR